MLQTNFNFLFIFEYLKRDCTNPNLCGTKYKLIIIIRPPKLEPDYQPCPPDVSDVNKSKISSLFCSSEPFTLNKINVNLPSYESSCDNKG